MTKQKFTNYVRKEGKYFKISIPKPYNLEFEEYDIVDVELNRRPTNEEKQELARKKIETEDDKNDERN